MKIKEFRRFSILGVLIVIFIFIIFLSRCVSQSAGDFLLNKYDEATEVLYQESVSSDCDIIFFLDNDGYVFCAVLERKWLGYQILRVSGKIFPSNPGYLCSFYNNDDRFWIDWGIIADANVKRVMADSREMTLVSCPYGYQICWLLGEGKEPQNHKEEY